MHADDKEELSMSLQTELNIMDAYRSFVKERKYKNETELVISGDLREMRKSTAVPEPEPEHGKKGFFRR